MNFLKLFIISLVLIAVIIFLIGIGIFIGRKKPIKQQSCDRDITNDGILPGCGCGIDECCSRQE
ncbi:MAG: hypothetical protein JXR41_03390 [Bacteroidales bacterium]|nr:hypothetical protein [Bacteroidales bacterium]MBN2762110.1 hypothetical protein [Bacteroidales bacterium]